jgi:diacylglycerol kinase
MNEPNFRIQIAIVAVTVWLGFHYSISAIEWGLLIISLGGLLSSEMINTLVENFIDMYVSEVRPEIKIVKDVAAGFVLVTAITAALIIFLVFGNRVL